MKYPELAEAFAHLAEAVARGYMTEEEEAEQIERLKRDSSAANNGATS